MLRLVVWSSKYDRELFRFKAQPTNATTKAYTMADANMLAGALIAAPVAGVIGAAFRLRQLSGSGIDKPEKPNDEKQS